MRTHSNSQQKPKLNHQQPDGEKPPLTEETTDRERLKNIDASLEKAGFKFVTGQGASHYVGTHPSGNIRFSHSTKKPKKTSHGTTK